MQLRRDWLVLAAAVVGCVGLGQPEGDGDGLEVRLMFPELTSGTTTLRIGPGTGATRATVRAASADGAIALRGVDARPSRSCDR